MSREATIPMELTFCWRCGISYFVPAHLIRARTRDYSPVFCPSGHKNFYGEKPKPKMSAAEREARREKVRRIHAEEQAEARKLDSQHEL